MKERLLDVAKWGLILIIAAVLFYLVTPKYYFFEPWNHIARGDRITGTVELYTRIGWEKLGNRSAEGAKGGHD